MDMYIDYDGITDLFNNARDEDRGFLYENEVYSLLRLSGAETPPRTSFIAKGSRPDNDIIMSFAGEKAVLKIVSPTIVHKTELGGVRIVPKNPDNVRSTIRRMLFEVPEKYAEHVMRDRAHAPEAYKNVPDENLVQAISRDIRGVMQVQFMPPDSDAFGNELIVGLRRTREFGMVISAGLGGTDTEVYAERFRKGQAVVAASTAMTDGQGFFELFKGTISYRKLAGLTRGQRRIVTDDQLIECFASFISMGNYYSEHNQAAPFYIDELEINPFAFTDFLMVPLDGVCRFSASGTACASRPVGQIGPLLHPQSIGIIGVSSTRRNFGRIILENVLAAGFDPAKIVVIREGEDSIDGVRCVPNLAALPQPLDLFVVAIGAEQVPALTDEIIALNAAKSVMLIPGGIGETEDSRDMAAKMIAHIEASHAAKPDSPVFLGANCMGVISRPGGYDTWFIPKTKYPRAADAPYTRTALISQSGAFMLCRTSQMPELAPAYMISMGNQTDLTLGDMMQYFTGADTVDAIAVYAEGFKDMDGLTFAKAVEAAVLAGKEVIFYKAGRTPEGKNATSGHTASLAGDYMVCESCMRRAGAIVARTFTEFQNLLYAASVFSRKKVGGKNMAAVSGAGFEAVGMADSLHTDDYSMPLGKFGESTKEALRQLLARKKLDRLVTVQNPLDINPSADDETHIEAARIVLADDNIHALAIGLDPLSPNILSLPDAENPAKDLAAQQGIVGRLKELLDACEKPVVTVVEGGELFAPMRKMLKSAGIPVFTTCDTAIAVLSIYMESRLYAERLREARQ